MDMTQENLKYASVAGRSMINCEKNISQVPFQPRSHNETTATDLNLAPAWRRASPVGPQTHEQEINNAFIYNAFI